MIKEKEDFFNFHPLFRHLEGGVVKELGDGWTEKSKIISDNSHTAVYDIARNYKLARIGGWKDLELNRIVEIFKNHSEIKTFLEEIKEGDKVESYVAFKDFLAASGGWRIVRKGEIVKWYRTWIS